MTLFILFQTDSWKTTTSRVFFGVFDCRNKAIDCAKYNELYTSTTEVVIEEIQLNQFEDTHT